MRRLHTDRVAADWRKLSLARGNCVVKTIESEPTTSWLQRARPECTSSASAGHDPAASPGDDRSVDCWDPWEVWLRYIDQPRRQRAGCAGRRPPEYGSAMVAAGTTWESWRHGNNSIPRVGVRVDRHPHPRRSPDADSAVLTASSRLGYNQPNNQWFASANLTPQARRSRETSMMRIGKLALVALVAFATPAMAERTGFYVGGDIGQSNWNLSQKDANNLSSATSPIRSISSTRPSTSLRRATSSATRRRRTASSLATSSWRGSRSKRAGWTSAAPASRRMPRTPIPW